MSYKTRVFECSSGRVEKTHDFHVRGGQFESRRRQKK